MVEQGEVPFYAAVLQSQKESGWLRTSTIAAGRHLIFGVVSSTHTYRVQNPSDRFREALLGGEVISEEEAARSALDQVNAIDDLDFVSALEFAVGVFEPTMAFVDLAWIGGVAVIGISGDEWKLINDPHLVYRQHKENERDDFSGRMVTRAFNPTRLAERAERRSIDLRSLDWVVFSTCEPDSLERDKTPPIALPDETLSSRILATSIANAWIDGSGIYAEISVVVVNLTAGRAKYARSERQ